MLDGVQLCGKRALPGLSGAGETLFYRGVLGVSEFTPLRSTVGVVSAAQVNRACLMCMVSWFQSLSRTSTER